MNKNYYNEVIKHLNEFSKSYNLCKKLLEDQNLLFDEFMINFGKNYKNGLLAFNDYKENIKDKIKYWYGY